VTTRTFCTILSRNYLPKALALGESLRRHEDGATLRILFIDVAREEDLPAITGVECMSTVRLGLSARRVQELAMSYDLVEFATAVKPLLLAALLETSDQAFYLDPDTYLVAPMEELTPALAASPGGILLTPHFLGPPPADADHSDGHLLLVGVNNLGFCGVDRRAGAALDWWWSHLETECLYDPLAGLFVDQKWMDIGSSHYQASSFRHPGYNVSVANLWERPLTTSPEGYRIASSGDPLRMFHFHAFDSSAPEKLSLRARRSYAHLVQDDSVVLQLCKEYASVLSSYEDNLPAAPPYPYATDTRGRVISRQLRRAYGRELRQRSENNPLPSPFELSEAAAYERWRRRAWRPITRGLLAEGAKCVRIVLPEEYDRLTKRFPRLGDTLRDRFSDGEGSWG
jgi:hypothetical protein